MLFNLWARIAYFVKDFSLYLIIIVSSFILLLFTSYKIYKSELSQEQKRIFLSLAFTVFSLILFFSAFEAYFRYVYDQSDGLGFLKVNQRWHARHVVYNSDFFRDRNFGPKKEGTTRICALGDSITFGGGIKNVEDRFSNLLEKKLTAASYNVEVYNLGRSGYDTDGEIKVYRANEGLNCDIVVWQYFINDIQPEGASTGTPVIERGGKTSKFIKHISNNSYLFDYLYWRLSTRHESTFRQLKGADLERYSEPQTTKHHKEVIGAFLKDLEENNKKVVVVIFPFVHLLPNYPAADIHQKMSQVFKENGTEVVDLLDLLRGKNSKDLIAGKFDYHPNEYVHRLTAEKIYEKIVPLLAK